MWLDRTMLPLEGWKWSRTQSQSGISHSRGSSSSHCRCPNWNNISAKNPWEFLSRGCSQPLSQRFGGWRGLGESPGPHLGQRILECLSSAVETALRANAPKPILENQMASSQPTSSARLCFGGFVLQRKLFIAALPALILICMIWKSLQRCEVRRSKE